MFSLREYDKFHLCECYKCSVYVNMINFIYMNVINVQFM